MFCFVAPPNFHQSSVNQGLSHIVMSAAKPMKLELQAEFPYEEVSEHAGLGAMRTVGYAVKGTPFRVNLKVISKSKVSLSHAHVQLQLLAEETYAPVEIGERPVKWEATTSGSTISCETRLMVLSTQVCTRIFFVPFLVEYANKRTSRPN
jgi:hypothetical protein